jgi:prepilin-type N-terminal cleavage/methylation domain-containing protein
MEQRMNLRKAFTIVEVLVVIMIICILATLLFPALSASKGKAKQTVCISNLRQIYIALQLYRDDNGEYPPNSFEHEGFRQYYKEILACPQSRDGRHAYDYLAAWFFAISPDSHPAHGPFVQAWEDCKAQRQGSLPIVFDENHRHARSKPGDVVVLVREAGSVSVVPALVTRVPGPCSTIVNIFNL